MAPRIRMALVPVLVAALVGWLISFGMAPANAQAWSQIEVRFVSSTEAGDRLPRLLSPDPIVVERVAVVHAGGVREVKLVDNRPSGQRYLSFELNDSAARALAEATASAAGRQLAIIVGGKVAAVLTVRVPLSGRHVAVTTQQDSDLDAIQAAMSR